MGVAGQVWDLDLFLEERTIISVTVSYGEPASITSGDFGPVAEEPTPAGPAGCSAGSEETAGNAKAGSSPADEAPKVAVDGGEGSPGGGDEPGAIAPDRKRSNQPLYG